MKFLIAGLGNIGSEYEDTRHNIGFLALDALARDAGITFDSGRHAFFSTYRFKGRTFILVKPTTYMNLSGKAINYWLQQEKIPHDRLLVITDDLALPFGTLRLRAKGSDGGHNGLKNINQVLGRNDYARLRFGIGNNFQKGRQINYVLNAWTDEENEALPERLTKIGDAIRSFGTVGVNRTMSDFNGK